MKMTKPYLSESEVEEFKARIRATFDLGEKHGAKFTNPGNISFNPVEVIGALSVDRLDKSSRRLEWLTWALVGLTVILTILTGISMWEQFLS